MKKYLPLLLALCASVASAATVNYFWNNSGTDMNSASSYSRVDTGEVSAVLPDSDDLVWFHGLPEKQPHLTSDLTLWGIRFASTNDVSKSKFYASTDDGLGGYNHCGWVMTGAECAVLTLTRGANLGQSENNQCVIASCSYGTNRIECAVHVPNATKIMGNAGRLVLAGPISQSASGTTYIMDSGGSGGVVLAAANPDFLGILDTSHSNVELAHPRAICAVKRVVLTSSSGGGTPRYFRNLTGGEIVDGHPFQFWMNKCEATYFVGPPMRFTHATLCPDSGQNRVIWVEESLTVGAVSNRTTTTSGTLPALDYYGAGTFHVLGDFGPRTIPAVTNVLRIMGGTVALHDPQVAATVPVSFGINGTNSRRPRLGLFADHAVKRGFVPGGAIYWSNNCDYGGWAAYGGDHDLTLEAETDGILRLHGWKGNETGLSAGLTWGGGSDWWKVPRRLFFGAEDADGTVTLRNGTIDVNLADSNGHFEVGAFQGGAFVAGRIAGSVTNGMANFLNRQIQKYTGDGAIAFDGPVYLSGAHNVSTGGLLFNNARTEGTVTVKPGAWLGGTGRIHALSVQAGGALRPGELGGTLTSDGRRPGTYDINGVTFADGSSFVVDIGEADGADDVHGCLALTGSGYPCKAAGAITVVPNLVAKLQGGRTVKILDWSGLSNPTDTSLFNVQNWSVDADPDVFSRAELFVRGDAMYLQFSLANTAPTAILLF